MVLTWWIIQSGDRGTMVFVNSSQCSSYTSKKTENIYSICIRVALRPLKHVPNKCMLKRFQDLSSAHLWKLILRSWVFLSHSNWSHDLLWRIRKFSIVSLLHEVWLFFFFFTIILIYCYWLKKMLRLKNIYYLNINIWFSALHKYIKYINILKKYLIKFISNLSRFVKHFSGDCGMDWLFLQETICYLSHVGLLSAAVIEKGGKGPLLLNLQNKKLLEVICHID